MSQQDLVSTCPVLPLLTPSLSQDGRAAYVHCSSAYMMGAPSWHAHCCRA